MTWAGWALAAAFAAAYALRRRGEFEVWKGHAHLHSNRLLDEAMDLASEIGGRVVVRRSGIEVATVNSDRYAAARAAATAGEGSVSDGV